MPITDLSYEDMQKLAADHTCGQCGGYLNVAWVNNQWALRCGRDLSHNTVTRHDKSYEKQIQEIRRVQHMDSKSLMVMPKEVMLQRIGMAKFPQELTPPEKSLLAEIAITYGFDPLMGEVTIYQGRPYVSIDGRYRKAQDTGELDGVETRPASKQERADWGIVDGDYFFRTEVYRKGASHPFVGWGRVRKAETLGGKGFKPVETNPQRMAEKRAEAQGLRKGFHIPLPSTEDIGTPEVEESVTATVDPTPEPPAMPSSTSTKQTTAGPEPQPDQFPPPAGEESKPPVDLGIDMDWLRESLTKLQWTTAGRWLKNKYPKATGVKVSEIVKSLTLEQRKEFATEVERRLTEIQ